MCDDLELIRRLEKENPKFSTREIRAAFVQEKLKKVKNEKTEIKRIAKRAFLSERTIENDSKKVLRY